MRKRKLLPVLAAKGVIQNGKVYGPYLIAGAFSAFTFFVFSSILQNDLMETLPHSAYAWMLLEIGRVLLGIILLPFLFYANSFLIKRRKKEMGLYSLLGLEKKHIGLMLLCETALIYAVSMLGGVGLGTVLAKLLFLLLLRLSGLPVDVEFVLSIKAVTQTLFFFAVVFLCNYLYDLWELQKAQPVELLAAGKKGEKEPKLLWLWSAIGVAALALGYVVAVRTKMDSDVFFRFFEAVFLVIVGTDLLFTSGSVALLRLARKNKGFYYTPSNFITVSGMYYRMKKSAAGLANICIFSTMVIITLTCTVALYAGLDGIIEYAHPYDAETTYDGAGISSEEVEKVAEELAADYGATVERLDSCAMLSLYCGKEKSRFTEPFSWESRSKNCNVYLMDLEDYERLTGRKETLEDGQALIYSTRSDFGYEDMEFMGIKAAVKENEEELFAFPKSGPEALDSRYVIILRNEEQIEDYVRAWAKNSSDKTAEEILGTAYRRTGVLLSGEDQGKEAFVQAFCHWCNEQTGYYMSSSNGLEGRESLRSMNGGLLFIGIVFGLIFFMCLLLIMYYKQVSEGYEDQGSFLIMQKVGMSDPEIRSTVKKQIFMVFAFPLALALVHTAMGMFMVNRLMAVLRMFNTGLLVGCAAGVAVIFMVVYGVSYLTTSRTYYRIVGGGR